MGFVNRIDQTVAKYWYPNTKNGGGCHFFWMVDVVIQGAWVLYCINKDKGDESLPLLFFRKPIVNVIFPKYSKEGRFSIKPFRNSKYPIGCLL